MRKRTKISYYMYGKHSIFSAIKNPRRKILHIYCTQEVYLKHQDLIKNHVFKIVDSNFIASKIDKNKPHQGIIALVETIYQEKLTKLNDKIVILDQITDSHNVGAIIRNAAAFDINQIILSEYSCPDENATITKSSCGALEFVEIFVVKNIHLTINKLKKNGFWIVGLDIDGENKIEHVKDIKKLAIIIGSENKGMRRLTKELCDYKVRINISNKVESLNASVAAGILFHEIYKN